MYPARSPQGWLDKVYSTASFPSRDKTLEHQYDIMPLQGCLARKAYQEVIGNPQLFWLAFCQAYAQLQSSNQEEFSVNSQGLKLEISGKIVRKVERFVKKIGEIFSNNYTTYAEQGYILIIQIRSGIHIFVHEESSYIEICKVVDPCNAIKLKAVVFERIVLPTLSPLCEMLGATCSQVVFTSFIQREQGGCYSSSRMDALQIENKERSCVKKKPIDEMWYWETLS